MVRERFAAVHGVSLGTVGFPVEHPVLKAIPENFGPSVVLAEVEQGRDDGIQPRRCPNLLKHVRKCFFLRCGGHVTHHVASGVLVGPHQKLIIFHTYNRFRLILS